MDQLAEEVTLGNVAPIVRIAHTVIEQAIKENASEILIEPGSDKMSVYYRVAGELHWVIERLALPLLSTEMLV